MRCRFASRRRLPSLGEVSPRGGWISSLLLAAFPKACAETAALLTAVGDEILHQPFLTSWPPGPQLGRLCGCWGWGLCSAPLLAQQQRISTQIGGSLGHRLLPAPLGSWAPELHPGRRGDSNQGLALPSWGLEKRCFLFWTEK